VGYGFLHAGSETPTTEEREYGILVDRAVDPTKRSLVTDVEAGDWDGWRNYGDYLGSEAWQGSMEDWGNGMMDYPTGLLVQYLRTGHEGYWRLGVSSGRHVSDIGLVKFHPYADKFSGTVHRKGECPALHSHTCTHPIAGQSWAHRSLLLLYHLTGDPWLLETAMMNIEYSYALSAPRVGQPTFLAAAGRDMAWVLGGLLAGYVETGQARYLDMARQIFERHVVAHYDPVTGAVLNSAVEHPYLPARAPGLEPWMAGFTGDTLIYYHRLTGDRRAADIVVGLARFLRDLGTRKSRIPAKGEEGYLPIIPASLAGKTPRYVLYNWTYEQTLTRVSGTVSQARGGTLVVEFQPGQRPLRLQDLRGKLAVVTQGAGTGRSFLIASASGGRLEVGCDRGSEGQCSDDLQRDGVRSGDHVVILQPGEYHMGSVTYNFVILNTLAFATAHSGDPSYLALAREFFDYAAAELREKGGYLAARQASDYLAFPHLFLDLVTRSPRR
jgi:hypothetical protein